ncbi:hypothetical protein AYO37_01060 [Opitutia bacterium SCGC AG-212-L18]|nr:hypothetical protein AYO37_01060 [Opitutae bacterium SCGC AG-212-L18]
MQGTQNKLTPRMAIVVRAEDASETTQGRVENEEVKDKQESGASSMDTPLTAWVVEQGSNVGGVNKRPAPDIEDINSRPMQRSRVEGPRLKVGEGQVLGMPQQAHGGVSVGSLPQVGSQQQVIPLPQYSNPAMSLNNNPPMPYNNNPRWLWINPNSSAYQNLMSLFNGVDFYLKNQQYQEARVCYNECLKSSEFIKLSMDVKEKFYFNLITVNLRLKDNQGAREAFEKALGSGIVNFGKNVTWVQQRELFFSLLDVYKEQENYGKIKIVCDFCLRCSLDTDQKKGKVYFNLLKACIELKLSADEIKKYELDWLLIDFSEATDVEKGQIYFFVSSIYFQEEKKDRGKIRALRDACLKIGSLKDDQRGDVYNRLGLSYYVEERYDEAITAYENSLSFSPKEVKCAIYMNLGYAYTSLKKYELARQFFEQGLNLPKTPHQESIIYFELGVSCRYLYLQDIKNEDKASEMLEKSLRMFEKCLEFMDYYPGKQKCIICFNISDFSKNNDFIKAIDYSLKAIEHAQGLDDKDGLKPMVNFHYQSFGSSINILKEILKKGSESTADEEALRFGRIIAKIYELNLIRD